MKFSNFSLLLLVLSRILSLYLLSASQPRLCLTLQPRCPQLGLVPADRALGLHRACTASASSQPEGDVPAQHSQPGFWPGSTLQRGCWPCPHWSRKEGSLGALRASIGTWSLQREAGLGGAGMGWSGDTWGLLSSPSATHTPRCSTCAPCCCDLAALACFSCLCRGNSGLPYYVAF